MASLSKIARLQITPKFTILPANAAPVVASSNTRPLWFDGRFLASHDLAREQNYFLRRQAIMARAGGFGVLHGLTVDQGQPAGPETIVIHAGAGITPSGALVMLTTDLTIQLSDIADEENLDEEFGLATSPQQPSRTRTGLYVIALRSVQFTANPITFYPANLQSPRVSKDGDIVEATAVSLVPYTNPVNQYDGSLQQAALARQIFVTGDTGNLATSLLPLAMVSVDRGVIQWMDNYLVRRDSGPQLSETRLQLADPSVQQAFLLQYTAQLEQIVATRQAAGQKANFAASDYLQALPPGGPVPLDAINTANSQQTFFPQQMNVELNIIPEDELPAVIADSLLLPPLDLTLSTASYANLLAYVLILVPRNSFASLAGQLSAVTLNPSLPQTLLTRQSLLPVLSLPTVQLRNISLISAPNPAWATAIAGQTYGYYLLRRSEPVFEDFTVPPPAPTTTTPAPTTTAAPATTLASTTTSAPTTTPAVTTTPAPATTAVATTTVAPKLTISPGLTIRPVETLPPGVTINPVVTLPPTLTLKPVTTISPIEVTGLNPAVTRVAEVATAPTTTPAIKPAALSAEERDIKVTPEPGTTLKS